MHHAQSLGPVAARSEPGRRSGVILVAVIGLGTVVGLAGLLSRSYIRPIAAGRPAVEARSPGLAALALATSVESDRSLKPDELASLEARMRPGPDAELGQLLHALHYHGDGAHVADPSGRRLRVVDLLLDSDLGTSFFGGSRPLKETRHGARFVVRNLLSLGTNQRGSELHPGQTLAVLAEVGVPLSQPIRLAGGRSGRLQMVLDDLVANFTLSGEIFWEASALALYVPPARSWKTKFGATVTFDQLARELLSRPVHDSACAGTHRLSALLLLLRVDLRTPILSRSVADSVRAHLRTVVRAVVESQRADGAWRPDWYTAIPGTPASLKAESEPDASSLILTTGHLAEWLTLLPEGLSPPRPTLTKATGWVLPNLERESRSAAWMHDSYCPFVHALRSLKVLSGEVGTGRPTAVRAADPPPGRPGAAAPDRPSPPPTARRGPLPLVPRPPGKDARA